MKANFLRERMVENQLKKRGILDEKVLNAFLKLPREQFAKTDNLDDAYGDYPLDIGYKQTISQPYIVAFMTEALALNSSDVVLEIGTGSGYQTAILAEITKRVYTVERIAPLLEEAKKILNNLAYKNINYFIQDGTKELNINLSFDAILVAAATNEVPVNLIKQLKIGGKMIIPLGSPIYQELTLITKTKTSYHLTSLLDCRFVPLIIE